MSPLDLLTPYDDLRDLRAVLSAQQIAELTGLRRETISRARPDRRFRRQTAKKVTDLNVVVSRLRSLIGEDPARLAALLERPQSEFEGNSIAELIRGGRVEIVLDHLADPEEKAEEQLENLQLDPDVLVELSALESEGSATATDAPADGRAADLIAGDPKLGRRLPKIERKIQERFGAGTKTERAVVVDSSDPDSDGHLYLGIRSSLPLAEQIDRLEALLSEEEELLEPVQTRLTIGTL